MSSPPYVFLPVGLDDWNCQPCTRQFSSSSSSICDARVPLAPCTLNRLLVTQHAFELSVYLTYNAVLHRV